MIKRRNCGSGHTYHVGDVRFPGVTAILKMLPKAGLIDYAGRVTAEYAIDHWDELAQLLPSQRLARLRRARHEDTSAAARRGTRIHKLAESYIRDPEIDVPEELEGHVDSYIDFLERLDVRPVAVELVVANRAVGYCGTTDLIADLPALAWDGGMIPAARWDLDIKTSRSGIWPESALQTCAYSRAEVYADADREIPMDTLGIQRCGAVWVRADGWDLVPLETGPDVWDFFQRLAWLHALEDDMKTWVGAAIDPPVMPLDTPAPAVV